MSDDDMIEFVRNWRKEFVTFTPCKMGLPKRCNKVTYYSDCYAKGKKVTIPGHVRAGINWNNMCSINQDLSSERITDGHKAIVCKLLKNQLGIDSIAYPIDQVVLPEWFKVLPFDVDEMVAVAIDSKIKNIFGLLGWDLSLTQKSDEFKSMFSFE